MLDRGSECVTALLFAKEGAKAAVKDLVPVRGGGRVIVIDGGAMNVVGGQS